jgi:L-aminopeptidase/D-esterase-like protein
MPGSPTMWAWYLEQAGELGGQTFPTAVTGHAFEVKTGMASNTTIGVVATDAVLNHEDLQRLAMMSQDGYARAIRPVHTPFDGDTLFAISTEAVPVAQEPVTLLRLGTIAADVVARAIMRGVFHAADIAGHQSYATRWGAHLRGGG